MIPLAANIPLTLCSVVLRRVLDSYTGRLPVAVASSAVPTASTVALFSGALVCLYHQLKKGTLVKIGLGKRVSSLIRNSRHTIQRRVKNNSWFLRNIESCRRKCTEAMYRITHPSNDSVTHMEAETGIVDAIGTVGETTSLPLFHRRRNLSVDCRRNVMHLDEPPLENLYSNDSFDSDRYSKQDLNMTSANKEESKKKKTAVHVTNPQRPITRNYRKSFGEQDDCMDGRKLPTKKRRKPDPYIINDSDEEPDDFAGHQESPESISTKLSTRRHSDRIKREPKIQKITRKTRSGRVYVYRL